MHPVTAALTRRRALIVIIAGLVLSLMRFQQGGGKLPGPLANMPNIGGKHPGGPQV